MPRKKEPKTTRRARGTGSIFPDTRRGGWRARKKGCGEKWSLSHAACVAWLNAALPPPPTITLADWYERWIGALDVKEQSKGNYRDYFKLRILPSLGIRQVSQITPFDIEEVWRQWGSGEQGVGATTIRLTLGALSTCLQAALRANIVSRNPVTLARKPKPVAVEHDIFTRGELDRIIGACLADRKLHPLAACAAVGVRIGEAIGHRPEDYDPSAGTLCVTRTLVVRTGGFGPPKSENSLRTIPAPAYLAPALARPPDTTRYRTFLSRWEQLLKRLEIRYRGTHQLRHTVASHLNATGVPIADAARHMGHSVKEYVETYCHATGYDVRPSLEGLYSGAKVAPAAKKRKKTKRTK
jgi:integrase